MSLIHHFEMPDGSKIPWFEDPLCPPGTVFLVPRRRDGSSRIPPAPGYESDAELARRCVMIKAKERPNPPEKTP